MARLSSNLTNIALSAPEAASEALLQTAADIVDVMKQIVPVDTGALRQSIGADPVDSHTVNIGSDKEYAAPVNYGTYKSAAQPFLEPAFLQARDTFAVRLQEAMEKRSSGK